MQRTFLALYFFAMAVEIVMRVPHERNRKESPPGNHRVTLAELAPIAGFFITMIVLPLAYSLTSSLDFANYPISRVEAQALGGGGLAVLAGAVSLFVLAHRDLGESWSPWLEVAGPRTLVSTGIYRSIRHPMYSSYLLWSGAQAMLLQNWIAGLAGFVGFLPLYLIRIPTEEAVLVGYFGDAYRMYRERTGAVFPRLTGLRRKAGKGSTAD